MTNTIKSVLTQSRLTIRDMPTLQNGDIRELVYLVFICWFHHITDTTIGTPANTWMLETLASKTSDCDLNVSTNKTRCLSGKIDIMSLIDRYVLSDSVFKLEVYPTLSQRHIHLLLTTMMIPGCEFGPISEDLKFLSFVDGEHPINELRSNRERIRKYTRDLAYREDCSDHQLVRDHACLSSVILMFTLSYLYVTITHENKINPEPALDHLLSNLKTTIVELTAIFSDPNYQWMVASN
jgi:hypothetical protein